MPQHREEGVIKQQNLQDMAEGDGAKEKERKVRRCHKAAWGQVRYHSENTGKAAHEQREAAGWM